MFRRAATILFLISIASTPMTLAQIKVTTSAGLNLRSAPSRTNNVMTVIPANESLEVLPDAPQGGFFKVRRANSAEGWAHGDYLLLPNEQPPLTPEATGTTAAAAAHIPYPDCGDEHHYRWLQKTTTSGFAAPSASASVSDVLAWTGLSFHGHTLSSWCIPRTAKEQEVKTVEGWVRRIKPQTPPSGDGDVHIEITQTPDENAADCIVVEIPPESLSPQFATARSDLASLLGLGSLSDNTFDPGTKRLKFTGLAFFDGWHLTGSLPVDHGRCNSTVGAAWELHPVFKVEAP